MKVLIIAGSESDMKIAKKAAGVLDQYNIKYNIEVASAHREPDKVEELVKKDYDVFIAIAGLSAALPGFIASHTVVNSTNAQRCSCCLRRHRQRAKCSTSRCSNTWPG